MASRRSHMLAQISLQFHEVFYALLLLVRGGTWESCFTCLEVVADLITLMRTVYTWPPVRKVPYFLMYARWPMMFIAPRRWFLLMSRQILTLPPSPYYIVWPSIYSFSRCRCLPCEAFLLLYEVYGIPVKCVVGSHSFVTLPPALFEEDTLSALRWSAIFRIPPFGTLDTLCFALVYHLP